VVGPIGHDHHSLGFSAVPFGPHLNDTGGVSSERANDGQGRLHVIASPGDFLLGQLKGDGQWYSIGTFGGALVFRRKEVPRLMSFKLVQLVFAAFTAVESGVGSGRVSASGNP
jgi:hypothetical protein